MPDWKLRCDALLSEDERRTETRIQIRLGSGITIEGLIDIEAAKTIFRAPETGEVLTGEICGRQASVVLPVGTVLSVSFPYVP